MIGGRNPRSEREVSMTGDDVFDVMGHAVPALPAASGIWLDPLESDGS
jgi:hypothetical protein